MDRSAEQRLRMVANLQARGICDPRVLFAMREVPRHLFVGPAVAHRAYGDTPLPIGEAQTISQPFIVALMAQALRLSPSDRVLEIGTGSGYGAAVLSRLVEEVFTVERHRSLAGKAQQRLRAFGYVNVTVIQADGTKGLPAHAPFDAISVTAAGAGIPEPLLWQLSPGGRLVIPVGGEGAQKLLRVTRGLDGGFTTEDLGEVLFVPLIGDDGAADPRG